MSEVWQRRLGVSLSAVTEWGWVAARALVGLAAALVMLASGSPGEASFGPAMLLIGLFLAYDAVLAALLLQGRLWLAFVIGSILDNVMIVGGWWWASYLSSQGAVVGGGDLYLILFPLLILGTARIGWKLGIPQMILWIGVLALTGWVYAPDSEAFQQLPIRIPLLAITGGLSIQLLSRLTAGKERVQYSEAQLQESLVELHESRQRLTEIERLRIVGEMAAGIIHDINNEAVPIVGYTELLLERANNLEPAQRRQIEAILCSGRDIVAILERLRDFSHRRGVGGPLEPRPVDMNVVVDDVVELSRLRLRQTPSEGSEIVVATLTAPGLPRVRGSEAEFREALLNLVINAADAMPQGGTLTIRTYLDRLETRCVFVEVADTGTGMDPATLARATQTFFTTKGEHGTGMGLPMVQSTVDQYNGTLDIESRLGEGTTIRMAFPVDEAVLALA